MTERIRKEGRTVSESTSFVLQAKTGIAAGTPPPLYCARLLGYARWPIATSNKRSTASETGSSLPRALQVSHVYHARPMTIYSPTVSFVTITLATTDARLLPGPSRRRAGAGWNGPVARAPGWPWVTSTGVVGLAGSDGAGRGHTLTVLAGSLTRSRIMYPADPSLPCCFRCHRHCTHPSLAPCSLAH